jgi:hypothetical protein
MATDRYKVEEQLLIQHQAGDTGDIVLDYDPFIVFIGRTVKFAVYKGSSTLLFMKTQPEITILPHVSGTNVIIPMNVADTEGLYGNGYRWELEISVPSNPTYATIGQGVFEILRTYIPSQP